MTFRPDIHVEWERSPRLIIVESPSTVLAIQDLVDTVRELESQISTIDDVRLLDASGKQDLGGGTFVGITIQLINAQVAFESRVLQTSTGTATANNIPGTNLIDNAATFLNDGISPGDTLINLTDGSLATIKAIVSDTELETYPLAGGLNQWSVSDSYKVLHNTICAISGGNLTAVDSIGDNIFPISPTLGTNVSFIQTTSATAIGLDLSGVASAVWSSTEALPGTHGEDLVLALSTIRDALALARLIPALV